MYQRKKLFGSKFLSSEFLSSEFLSSEFLSSEFNSELLFTPNSQLPVGLSGLEPLTPALSAQCSNRLSYRPLLYCA